MFAQWRKYRRVENLTEEAADTAPPVASNQQIHALDLGMPSQQNREKYFAEKSRRARQQDATALELLLERRRRRSVALAVATRHPRSPVAAGAGRLSRRSAPAPTSPSRSPRRACQRLPIRGARQPPALRIRPRSRVRHAGAPAHPSTTCRTDARRDTRSRSGTYVCTSDCA